MIYVKYCHFKPKYDTQTRHSCINRVTINFITSYVVCIYIYFFFFVDTKPKYTK